MQSWGHVSHYLDILKGRVDLTNIYEAPTRFKELHGCCGGYKDESDLDPALQGFTMMQGPWCHLLCVRCPNETIVKGLYSVLIAAICF